MGGALLGRLFLALVQTYKRPMWPAVTVEPESCEADKRWACGPYCPYPYPYPDPDADPDPDAEP